MGELASFLLVSHPSLYWVLDLSLKNRDGPTLLPELTIIKYQIKKECRVTRLKETYAWNIDHT